MGDKKTILLVEDTPELLETLRQALEGAGHEVICSSSGEEALNLLQSKATIGLLISDLVMPDVSGEMVIEAAMELRPAIRVIAMSGGKALAKSLSHVRVLQKPFSSKSLLAMLREMSK